MQHPLIRSFCICSIISARQCLPEGREEILVPIMASTWVTRTWWVGSRTAQQLSTLGWHSNSSSHQLEDKWQVSLSPSPCFINEQQTPLSVSSFKWCGYQWHSVLLCPPHSDRPNTLSISQYCSHLRDSLVRMLKPGVLVASWPSFSQAHVKTAQRNGQKSSREAFRLHSLTGCVVELPGKGAWSSLGCCCPSCSTRVTSQPQPQTVEGSFTGQLAKQHLSSQFRQIKLCDVWDSWSSVDG